MSYNRENPIINGVALKKAEEIIDRKGRVFSKYTVEGSSFPDQASEAQAVAKFGFTTKPPTRSCTLSMSTLGDEYERLFGHKDFKGKAGSN